MSEVAKWYFDTSINLFNLFHSTSHLTFLIYPFSLTFFDI